MRSASPEDVHRFWFADSSADPDKARQRLDFWFRSTTETDALIKERFGPAVQAVEEGALDAWKVEPRSCLALVIVLDQFPRNIDRDSAAAFARDAQALDVTKRGVKAGHLRALTTIEQAFFLMPFQHAEDVEAQREGLLLFEQMLERAAPEWRTVADAIVAYARLHLEIIERFGRFPHRNAILARTSTPQEVEYLQSNSETFGQALR